MRHLFILSSILFLFSCSYKNIEVTLLEPDHENDHTRYDIYNNIEVVDERKDQNLIGTKEFGDKEIEITNNQELTSLIREEIINDLQEYNSLIPPDKTLKISLKTLKYSSKRGLFLGKSKINVSLTAALIDNDSYFTEYNKSYGIEGENQHFIVSLSKTDRKNINSALEEVVDEIIDDENLQDIFINKNDISDNE